MTAPITTPRDPGPNKRTRTRRRKPGAGATALEFLFFLVVVAATYLYQSFVWILILLGTVLLVVSAVLTIRGVPDGESGSTLATGAIGLGAAALGVVLLLVMIRRFGWRFWDTIPFLPGPGL